MSNNNCDAARHKTKRFSFKRKPFDAKQIRNEPKKEVKKETKKEEIKETKNEVIKEAKVHEFQEPQEHHNESETGFHNKPKKADDTNYCEHNEQIETITENENSKMPHGFENKATQTRICCIHNHCRRKQRKRNGNFFPEAWFCLTNLCK
ncbi:uncharacterized protein LOC112597156 [Melanaphis sacchari]|uniref:uncharacterized protein LOC112597156 n=1 Tax=Melanaphis sacchari TaxID=742174 RepID=UPI000DC140DD|nr:uncharacterized protein LOC112597156 [Melanaphis sacchari]